MAVKEETRITQAVIEHIKALGGDAHHVHGSALQRGGEPDIDGALFWDNRYMHLKIEVKTPEGEPEERQLYRLNRYWHLGYIVGIVTSVKEFSDLLAAYSKPYSYSARMNLPYAKDIFTYGNATEERL